MLQRQGGNTMISKQKIEVFTSGCSLCNEVVDLIRNLACDECEVSVLDMHDELVASRAKKLGIHSIPAVVLDGKLATCCAGERINASSLRDAGLLCPVSA
jgi:predicted thioredoxin/glutaredoxin